MFFEDHEKKIFSPTGSDQKYDPLALDRAFRKESRNQFAKLIETWKLSDIDAGDISEEGRFETIKASDWAEEQLANISRVVFNLPPFPDCTDGIALEYLCEYLEWCKKKEMKDTMKQDYSTSGLPFNSFGEI